MACTPPLDESLGFAFLDYSTTAATDTHRTRVGLVGHHGPGEITTIRTEMEDLADLVAACLPNTGAVFGWGTMTHDGSVFYSEAFAIPKTGTHGAATGAEAYLSRTITITGKGTPSVPGTCAGQTRMVLFVGQAYNFTPGEKYKNAITAPEVQTVADFLAGSSVIWGDWYGQEASTRPLFPVQFNAAVQRRKGQ